MNLPNAAIEGVSIVLVGSFNPRIFQPAWFAAQKLIREEEATEADVELLRQEITVFSLDWLNVQVLQQRFIASATQPPFFEPLRDFVYGTFTILQHTPVRYLGLNTDRHFKMESEAAWNDIGKRLAPPDGWESVLKEPGMRSVTMQGKRPDAMRGAIHVKVEPSIKVDHGVFVEVNDHYAFGEEEDAEVPAGSAIPIMKDQWDSFLKRSDEIAAAIFESSS